MVDEQPLGMEYDALVRRVLGDLATAGAWLQARLPKDMVQRLDFATLQLQPGTFVDDEFRSICLAQHINTERYVMVSCGIKI